MLENFIIDDLSCLLSRERKRDNQAQLDSLRGMADMLSDVALSYPEVCPICPGQQVLNTKRQVYLHLNSRDHKARQQEAEGFQDGASSASPSTFRV